MRLPQIVRALLSLPVFAAPVFAVPAGYLFVTFKGEQTPLTEQIYFATSRDGREWTSLNNGDPVLVTDIGEKGARDPYLFRSRDGRKFFLIATDLSWNRDRSVSRAVRAGSRSILVWESADLVNWSAPRLVKVAPADAGCTWAPEAVYDEENGDYLVFWASTSRRDNFSKQRIWAARTKDFVTFGEPFVYIEEPNHVIDTTIVHDGDAYYRFTKDETYKAVTMETAPRLSGPWTGVTGFNLGKLVGYEGPAIYQLEPASPGKPAVWGLILDYYSKGQGYQPWTTTNLAGGDFQPAQGFKFPFKFRHGSVLPLSTEEYQAIVARWPGSPVVSLSLFDQPGNILRHRNFRLRLDENVNPADDGRWLQVSGLDGGRNTASFRSVNFPDHYLAATADGVLVQRGDGTPGFAAKASFVRMPGLASAEGVSFRLAASSDRYLKAEPSVGVSVGPVSTNADRRAATFTLHE
jgi:hypothetical protein